MPAVNQIELHPYFQNREVAAWGERHGVVTEAWAPIARGASCPTLRLCEATFVDPSFPGSPYRVRYRIAGEQVSGCWMGLKGATVGKLPYPDASTGRLQLAGCRSWLA